VSTLNKTGNVESGHTTIVYSAQLDHTTKLSMTYNFNIKPSSTTFLGTNLTLRPQSLKWSVNLSSSASGQAITLTYNLTQLSSSITTTTGLGVVKENNTPANNVTTYFLSIGNSSLFFDPVVGLGLLVGSSGGGDNGGGGGTSETLIVAVSVIVPVFVVGVVTVAAAGTAIIIRWKRQGLKSLRHTLALAQAL